VSRPRIPPSRSWDGSQGGSASAAGSFAPVVSGDRRPQIFRSTRLPVLSALNGKTAFALTADGSTNDAVLIGHRPDDVAQGRLHDPQ